MIKTLLIIGLGGFVGSVTRYILYYYFVQNYPTDYPWGTFVANLLGCFVIGIVFGLAAEGDGLNKELVFFLSVGFCGALTTFSTFSYENLLMFNQGKVFLALVYSGLSYTMGLILTWLGLNASKLLA